MPFKIVQTIENGEKCLTVVPSKWENANILLWPKNKGQLLRLINKEDSVPDANWEQLLCIKKRVCATKEEALDEVRNMEEQSDTDVEYTKTPVSRRKRCVEVIQKPDFNHLIIAADTPNNNAKSQPVPEHNFSNEMPLVTQYSVQELSPTEQYILQTTTAQNITDDEQNQKLDRILENQNKLMLQFAKLQTTISMIADFISNNIATTNNNAAFAHPKTMKEKIMEPMRSQQELEEFEEKLRDKEYLTEVVENMVYICGTSGKKKGIDCCYKLVDYLLSREFLVSCSWTGNSRKNQASCGVTQSEPDKVPLKFFKNFFNCFLEIIMKADSDFSASDCETFFKRILKNSKQRVVAKKILSCHKNRPLKLIYKKRNKNDVQIITTSVELEGQFSKGVNSNHPSDVEGYDGDGDNEHDNN